MYSNSVSEVQLLQTAGIGTPGMKNAEIRSSVLTAIDSYHWKTCKKGAKKLEMQKNQLVIPVKVC